jgi:hypothetical protein
VVPAPTTSNERGSHDAWNKFFSEKTEMHAWNKNNLFLKKNKEQEQSRVCTVTNVAVTMHGTNLFEKKIEMHAWNKNNLFLKNKEQEPSRVCVWCFTFTVHLFF